MSVSDTPEVPATDFDARLKHLNQTVRKFRETYQLSRRELRSAQAELDKRVAALEDQIRALGGGSAPRVKPAGQARGSAVGKLLAGSTPAAALPDLFAEPDLVGSLPAQERRLAVRTARQLGYWTHAVAWSTDSPANPSAAVNLWRSELALFLDPHPLLQVPAVGAHSYKRSDKVLHVVGHALPFTQTGYTIRTHETVKALRQAGVDATVVVQGGVYPSPGSVDHEGIEYVVLDAAARGRTPWPMWLQSNINSLAHHVRKVRPGILHAHSDFLNALIAEKVGEAFDIPVVYEQRGFWEDSWWSRVIERNAETFEIVRDLPVPDAYRLRQLREADARARADHVVTLSPLMAEHALVENRRLGLPSPSITVVSNAVNPDRYAGIERDVDLAASVGLTGKVIGYISSMVPYEGIGTLVQAFGILRDALALARGMDDPTAGLLAEALTQRADRDGQGRVADDLTRLASAVLMVKDQPDPHLLLVGSGESVENLAGAATPESGIHVMGSVPHESVGAYYSLIDLFVVPRDPYAVSDLVTPLKPFEALATGRTLLVSSVRALAQLASESAGAAVFNAGDAWDLATKAAHLLAHDEERRNLAARGREWVRTQRTWQLNAGRYRQVYEGMGAELTTPTYLEAVGRLDELGVDPDALIYHLQALDSPAGQGWFEVIKEDQPAEEVVRSGWRNRRSPVRIQGVGLDWEAVSRGDRSLAHHLHSWDLIQSPMTEYATSRDPDLLDWMLRVAFGWLDHARMGSSNQDDMAWYDMSIALRLPRLLHLVVWAAQAGRERDALRLAPALHEHGQRLMEPDSFNARNNHGFYAAAAGLDFANVLADHLGAPQVGDQARERMQAMIKTQFAPDGCHLEHSPAYHGMLLESFRDVFGSGLAVDADTTEILTRAEHVYGWWVQPNGRLAQFGDTDDVPVAPEIQAGLEDEATIFFASRGQHGTPASAELLVLRDGGYAVVRSPHPQTAGDVGSESYLAFAAAFHSRAHKHADDLTLIWCHRGKEVLVDSGRFGYVDLLPAGSPDRAKGFYYSRPERQYVESTVAHNTVEVDGKDHDRRRPPYGSGLVEAHQDGEGVFHIIGEAPHGHYTHRRRLAFQPGSELSIVDRLEFEDETDHAIAWFNLSGDLDVRVVGEGLEVLIPGSPEVIRVSSTGAITDLVRGQEEPLRGWRSRQAGTLDPTWSVGFRTETTGRASVEIVTTLTITPG